MEFPAGKFIFLDERKIYLK